MPRLASHMKGTYFLLAASINLTLVLAINAKTHAFSDHAFYWSSSTGMIDLGTLGGDYSHAYGINDSGQVTGYAALSSFASFPFALDGTYVAIWNVLAQRRPRSLDVGC